MLQSSIGFLRIIGFLEGVSYLLLLFIAMPLKYYFEQPQWVTMVGMAHGVLFVLFLLALLIVWIRHRWSFFRVIAAFIACLLPFGTFVLDVRLKKEMQADHQDYVLP